MSRTDSSRRRSQPPATDLDTARLCTLFRQAAGEITLQCDLLGEVAVLRRRRTLRRRAAGLTAAAFVAVLVTVLAVVGLPHDNSAVVVPAYPGPGSTGPGSTGPGSTGPGNTVDGPPPTGSTDSGSDPGTGTPVVDVTPFDLDGVTLTRLPAGFAPGQLTTGAGLDSSQTALSVAVTRDGATASLEDEVYGVTVLRGTAANLDGIASQGGALPSGDFFHDYTAEWTTVYGQRAVVLITTPGDTFTHPGFALWWNTPDAAIGITARHGDVAAVRGIAAGIEVGPSPPGPGDPVAATSAVTDMVELAFAGETPLDQRLAVVADGGSLSAAFEQFKRDHPESYGTAVVDQISVRFAGPNLALATFQVKLVMPGSSAGSTTTATQTAELDYEGSRWVVDHTSYCTILAPLFACPAS